MTPPLRARRERLIGMALFAVAAVLVVSSPTWFASGRGVVGALQVLLGLALAGAGVWLGRRARRGAAGRP